MLTEPEVQTLLAARALIDKYVLDKTDRSVRDWAHPSIPDLEKALDALGFKSIDEFMVYDQRESMLELSRCYKGVNRFTGEEPPICDGCLKRDPPLAARDCAKNPKTGTLSAYKVTCTEKRITAKSGWEPSIISLAEDSIYQAQLKHYTDHEIAAGLMFSLMDAIDWWAWPDHAPENCVARVVEVSKPLFDPFWRVGK